MEKWFETENLSDEMMQEFVFFYVLQNEKILDQRKNLAIFINLQKQTGEDVLYKSNKYSYSVWQAYTIQISVKE